MSGLRLKRVRCVGLLTIATINRMSLHVVCSMKRGHGYSSLMARLGRRSSRQCIQLTRRPPVAAVSSAIDSSLAPHHRPNVS